jgi:signal peptidase I
MEYELFLFAAVCLTGAAFLLRFLLPRARKNKAIKEIAALFLIVLPVFSFRSFAFEPFRIPSGSMKPVFLEGDFVFIDKFSHGLRWPVLGKRITQSKPKRGDIIVFKGIVNDKDSYVIKRVIGLPGDHIQYKNKRLYINNKLAEKHYISQENDQDYVSGASLPAIKYQETLGNITYPIYNYPFVAKGSYPFDDITVPEGKYFVMGNNRDNSADSRYFGLLDDEKIVGRARAIWMSFDFKNYVFRFNRIGAVA